MKDLQINGQIKEREVRLIDAEGNQLGIVPVKRAQELADEKKLDLVKVAPNAKPPVCRIMDYGKYKYEQAKKEKESRKNQKIINIKEIRLTPRIDEHDIVVKSNRAIKFLESGNKVKVTVRFKGREMGHTAIGKEVLEKFAELTSEVSAIEKKAKLEGRNMIMFLMPKN
ncbi:translation initiation factor IF-3 [Clostridiaceae bacterium M8S5]|nr:translation initiation factor IF-3 [Clostridiaceae bacterium M8S5]